MVDEQLNREGLIAHSQSAVEYGWLWALDSLPEKANDAISQALVDFVVDYNRAFAVKESQIVPACWPAHPGLAREIAALYAHWLHVFHSGEATATDATYFYDRVLPPFQSRIVDWLGAHPDACRSGEHPREWNPMAAAIEDVAMRADDTHRRLTQRVMQRLASTLSATHHAFKPRRHGAATELVSDD